MRKKKKESLDYVVERESIGWHQFRLWKGRSWCQIRYGESHLCILSFPSSKMVNLSLESFVFILGWFWVFGLLFCL
jgi:hypothetical protein